MFGIEPTKTNVNAIGAAIGGIPGIMIFPDDFSWPADGPEMNLSEDDVISEYEFYTTGNVNGTISIDYSVDDFRTLEKYGVAFLPCNIFGYNSGTMINLYRSNNTNGDMYLLYWECHNETCEEHPGFLFYPLDFFVFGKYPSNASSGGSGIPWSEYVTYYMSVRLVADAN